MVVAPDTNENSSLFPPLKVKSSMELMDKQSPVSFTRGAGIRN